MRSRIILIFGYLVLALIMTGSIVAYVRATQEMESVGGPLRWWIFLGLIIDACGLHIFRASFNHWLRRMHERGKELGQKPMSLSSVVYVTWGLMFLAMLASPPPSSESAPIGAAGDTLEFLIMFIIGFAVGIPMIVTDYRKRNRAESPE